MSDAKGQQHEPSMEEILASIRRIIAEDGDTAAPAAAPAAEADGVAPAPAPAPPPVAAPAPKLTTAPAPAAPAPAKPAPVDDILELTEVVESDGSVVSLSAAPIEAKPAAAEPPPRREEPAPTEHPAGERILSAATAAASVAALSQITTLSSRQEARERDLALGAGHLTLETLVREELRPILKTWLDQHLSDMVERLVQEEIAQLVRDVQRR
jgi:cell pole-organizing protein PopZ